MLEDSTKKIKTWKKTLHIYLYLYSKDFEKKSLIYNKGHYFLNEMLDSLFPSHIINSRAKNAEEIYVGCNSAHRLF